MEAIFKMLDFRVMALLYAALFVSVLLSLGVIAVALRVLSAAKEFLRPLLLYRAHRAPLPKPN
ncbi:MAG: hypothetical protein M0Z52_00295 [Actinomycetota bacterium]|nr:hypothetical protein [Actinomycetota bacterium]